MGKIITLLMILNLPILSEASLPKEKNIPYFKKNLLEMIESIQRLELFNNNYLKINLMISLNYIKLRFGFR